MLDLQPSIKNGYAPRNGVPANPGLLKGLKLAWCPSMGIQGRQLYNLAGTGVEDIPFHANLSNSAWRIEGGSTYLHGDGTSGDNLITLNAPLNDDFDQFSILCRCRSPEAPVNNRAWFARTNNFTTGVISLGQGSGTVRARAWGATVHATIEAVYAPIFNNVWTSLMYVRHKDNDHRLSIDGLEVGGTATATGSLLVSGEQWTILTLAAVNVVGDVSECYFWDRALSSAEIYKMYLDPLAPFRLKRNRLFIPDVPLPGGNEGAAMYHHLQNIGAY